MAAGLVRKAVAAAVLCKTRSLDLPDLPHDAGECPRPGVWREEWKAGISSLARSQHGTGKILRLQRADGENRSVFEELGRQRRYIQYRAQRRQSSGAAGHYSDRCISWRRPDCV